MDLGDRHHLIALRSILHDADAIGADDLAARRRQIIAVVHLRIVAELELKAVAGADDVRIPCRYFAAVPRLLANAGDHRLPVGDLAALPVAPNDDRTLAAIG